VFPLVRLCQVLEVSENGYYNWRKRGKSQRKQEDEKLAERIEDAYHHHRGHYGSPRIHADLKDDEIHCSRKRVARIMREKGLTARRKQRSARTTNSNHPFPVAPNLLQRDFTADAPDKKWMSDITYIQTQEGWLYLAGVIDAYSRKIVGWSMSEHHDAALAKAALHLALARRSVGADLIHHSDRGSEYASLAYQEVLSQHHIRVSMSKKGDCYDNAMIESFWGTLKEECDAPFSSLSRYEAKMAIFEYIEIYYNQKRRHSALGYLSPVAFEKREEAKRLALDE
jgi:putative transposase